LLLVGNPDLAQSRREATGLLNDAASAGNWRSSMLLGILARDGEGIPLDDSAAYYHFRIAVLQHGDEAAKLLVADLRKLSARLGPDRTRALDAQADAWYQQHHFVLEFVEKSGEGRGGFPRLALGIPENGAHAAQLVPALRD
jgi:hypothetical protein